MDVSNTDTEAALSSVREGALHEATAVQVIRRPKAHVNHTYYDYARVSLSDTLPINEREFMTRKRIDEMTFTQKVFHVLSQSVYYPIIRWRSHGRAFSVEIPKRLEDEVLPIYFGHRRYSSFLRQLSNHGFKVLTRGPDRNCQYHELMLRGVPHLCNLFPEPKDARRLIPDPENEPNFYIISSQYPLPNESLDYKAGKDEGSSDLVLEDNTINAPNDNDVSFASPPLEAYNHRKRQFSTIDSLNSHCVYNRRTFDDGLCSPTTSSLKLTDTGSRLKSYRTADLMQILAASTQIRVRSREEAAADSVKNLLERLQEATKNQGNQSLRDKREENIASMELFDHLQQGSRVQNLQAALARLVSDQSVRLGEQYQCPRLSGISKLITNACLQNRETALVGPSYKSAPETTNIQSEIQESTTLPKREKHDCPLAILHKAVANRHQEAVSSIANVFKAGTEQESDSGFATLRSFNKQKLAYEYYLQNKNDLQQLFSPKQSQGTDISVARSNHQFTGESRDEIVHPSLPDPGVASNPNITLVHRPSITEEILHEAIAIRKMEEKLRSGSYSEASDRRIDSLKSDLAPLKSPIETRSKSMALHFQNAVEPNARSQGSSISHVMKVLASARSVSNTAILPNTQKFGNAQFASASDDKRCNVILDQNTGHGAIDVEGGERVLLPNLPQLASRSEDHMGMSTSTNSSTDLITSLLGLQGNDLEQLLICLLSRRNSSTDTRHKQRSSVSSLDVENTSRLHSLRSNSLAYAIATSGLSEGEQLTLFNIVGSHNSNNTNLDSHNDKLPHMHMATASLHPQNIGLVDPQNIGLVERRYGNSFIDTNLSHGLSNVVNNRNASLQCNQGLIDNQALEELQLLLKFKRHLEHKS